SHTTCCESRNESRARHSRHSAGKRSWSSALRTQRTVYGRAHHLDGRRSIGKETGEGGGPLLHQHLATVLRRHAGGAQRARPARATGRVHQIERRDEAPPPSPSPPPGPPRVARPRVRLLSTPG